MKLYLIRHGESMANLKNAHAGWAQVPLSPKGFEQAKLAGHFLRKIEFDKIYSSDLIRAKQTALTALPNCEFEETELLREIGVGELSGKTPSECEQQYGKRYTDAHSAFDFTTFGGENSMMHRKRAIDFLNMVSNDDKQCVAAFSHAGTIREMSGHICGGNVPRTAFRISNCTVYGFEYENGVWRISLVLPTEYISIAKE